MLNILPQTFVTIVETGSITRAAVEMGLAKSAVSQNLKRLENQLDVKLAIRTTRRLSLTPAGEKYYQKCKEILSISQLAKTEMEVFGATPSGLITLTAPHALIAPIIAPAMARVITKYPKLVPRIIADDERLDLIAEGIDLSITVGNVADSGLRTRRVGSVRDILCIAPHLLDRAPPVDDPGFGDWVQSLPYIAHMREPAIVEHRMSIVGQQSQVYLRYAPSFRSNTIEAIG